MAEQIYTIPVNDAFDSECECPMCQMQKELERNAIEYTMGPSYMEDDNRAMTDKLGFCSHHLRLLYQEKNRLGLALMMNTHMNKTIKDMKELAAKGPASKAGLFGKSTPNAPIVDYIDNMEKAALYVGAWTICSLDTWTLSSTCGRRTPNSERNLQAAKDSVHITMVSSTRQVRAS